MAILSSDKFKSILIVDIQSSVIYILFQFFSFNLLLFHFFRLNQLLIANFLFSVIFKLFLDLIFIHSTDYTIL